MVSRCRLSSIIAGGLFFIAIDVGAEDALWSRNLDTPFLDSPAFSVAVLDRKGESGLQLAIVSGSVGPGLNKRFSFGFGYDEMVQPWSYGSRGSGGITEQLFLLQTPCDKRFQITLQLRW